MKANGKMVSAQEEAIVMTSLRNRTIVVISYVDIVMAEEGWFILMEACIRGILWTIYRMDKEISNTLIKIGMSAISMKERKKEKVFITSAKEQFFKVYGKEIQNFKAAQYSTMEMNLRVLTKIISVTKAFTFTKMEIGMKDFGKMTSNMEMASWPSRLGSNMKDSLNRVWSMATESIDGLREIFTLVNLLKIRDKV